MRPIEEIDVLVDGTTNQHHELIVDRAERGRAALLQPRVVLDEPLRRRDGSRRGLLGAREELRRDVGPREDRQDEHRNDGARKEREKQLVIEAGPHFAEQRAAAGRRAQRERAGKRPGGEQRDVQGRRQHDQLRQVDQMAGPADDRIPKRVNPAAVALEIHAKRLVVAIEGRPELRPRFDQALEDGVGQRPDTRPGFKNRRAAPSVHHELDVAARHAFRRRLPVRPQRLEIRALGRDERQRAVVEHHAHDDAADKAPAHADAPAGTEHVALARPERRHLLEQLIPGASGRSKRCRGVFRQAGEAAHEPSVRAVELDG